jgi:hypothetical protein
MNKILLSGLLLSCSVLALPAAHADTTGTVSISSAASTIEPQYDDSSRMYRYDIAFNTTANINAKELEGYLQNASVMINPTNNAIDFENSINIQGDNVALLVGNTTSPTNVNIAAGVNFNLAGRAETLSIASQELTTGPAAPDIRVGNKFDRAFVTQHPANFKNFAPINMIYSAKQTAALPPINAITVSTPADLQAINTNPAANYLLINNIDMHDYPFTTIKTFNGKLYGAQYGRGLTIYNLNVTNDGNATPAFIGTLTGSIERLTIDSTNAMLVGNMVKVAASARPLISKVVVHNAAISSTGQPAVGQISAATDYGIGALVGSMYSGSINNSVVAGTLTVDKAPAVGGLVGYMQQGTINHSGAQLITTVNSGINKNSNVGGLVGMIDGHARVQYSAALGGIKAGAANIGGFIGTIHAARDALRPTIIHDNSSTVRISDAISAPTLGDRYIGGFVGVSNAPITRAYTVSTLAIAKRQAPSLHIGGFAGELNAPVSLSHWDIFTTASKQAAGVIHTNALPEGDTDAQMQNIATYQGWNILPFGQDSQQSIWLMPASDVVYPFPMLARSPALVNLYSKIS